MRHAILRSLLVAVLALLLGGMPAGAILNGQPDGSAHPYVGMVFDDEWVCSGTAISPTILITAAHCFDVPGQAVSVTFEPDGFVSENFEATLVTGIWYPDPAYCDGCNGGLVGFLTHDVAVVILDEPVALERYAALPSVGQSTTLATKARVDIVGYGIQSREKKLQEGELFTRYFAISELSPSQGAISDEFLKLSANPAQGKGGVCFGDSGGPALIGDTILGVTSFGSNGNCAGVSYSYRIDTAEALAFIDSIVNGSGTVTAATIDGKQDQPTKRKHEKRDQPSKHKHAKGKHRR